MFISPSEATATVSCAVHTEKELLAAKYRAGYFLTDSELRDLFKAARTKVGHQTQEEWKYKDFEQFEREQE